LSTISDSGVRVSPHEWEWDYECECECECEWEVVMSIASSLVAAAADPFPSCIFSHSFFLLYRRHSTQSSNCRGDGSGL
jgi:hypothetical protein